MRSVTLPRIAVTGMGCVCGTHASAPALMRALHEPRTAPVPVSREAARHPGGYPVFALPDEAAAALSSVPDPGGSGPFSLTVGMARMAALEALAQAQLTPEHLAGLRSGVFLGSSSGATLNFSDFYFARRKGLDADPAPMVRSLISNPAQALARSLGLAPRVWLTLTNACASGTDALGAALTHLRDGHCDVVLAGGSDELCLSALTGFARLMIMDPEPCRPFDAARNGLNLGEGAAVLVLEREDDARRRGAAVLALCLGYGTAADAHHLTAPHPQGLGLKAAIQAALRDADLAADGIAFVNAHGTGTKENDKTEALVLRDVLPGALVSATKGCTGHTLGAAGAIEAVITVACLMAGALPPSPGFTAPHPELDCAPVDRRTPLPGAGTARCGLSQSLAFGGNNAAVIFSREDA